MNNFSIVLLTSAGVGVKSGISSALCWIWSSKLDDDYNWCIIKVGHKNYTVESVKNISIKKLKNFKN
jgi:hypothetical protein